MSNIDMLIDTVETEISDLQKTLLEREIELTRLKNIQKNNRIQNFEKKYSISHYDVVKNYLKLLNDNSYHGGKGYRVNCPGYNHPHYGKPHWVLKPDSREKCLPSEMVLEALAIEGQTVSIAENPHVEIWGN